MVRIGVAMLLVAAGCGGSTAAPPSSAPPTSHLTTVVHLDGDPFAVAVGPDGDVWTATHDGAQVLRVDASTRRVVSTTPIAGQGTALAMTGGGLWAVGWKHALYHIDAAGGHADRAVQLPRPDQVAVDGGRIWVTNWQRNTVSGVEAASGRVVATLKAGPPPRGGDQGVSAAIAGAGSIWVVRGDENAVYRIDPATGRTLARITVGDTPGPGAFAAGSVWITNLTGNSVSRIDPATNRVVATIATGVQPAYAVGNGGAVWVTDFGGDGLTRIDPATNRTRDVRVCYGPAGLAATAGALWVACPSAHELVRVAI